MELAVMDMPAMEQLFDRIRRTPALLNLLDLPVQASVSPEVYRQYNNVNRVRQTCLDALLALKRAMDLQAPDDSDEEMGGR